MFKISSVGSPELFKIGTILSFDGGGGDFYNILVHLSTDFHNIDWVYIIANLEKAEQDELEELIELN